MRYCRPMIVLIFLLGSVVLRGQSRQETWRQCTSTDPERSIAGCSALIQSGQATNTSLAKAFDNRGLAYARKHDFDRAIQDYNQALQLDPNSATARYNRGVAYEFKSDYDRALPDLDQAVLLDPSDADSVYSRGLVYMHRGDYRHAIQDYTQTLQINPEYLLAFDNRGLAYARSGDYNSAIQDYDRALQINPRFANAYQRRCVAYIHNGEYAQATSDWGHWLWLRYGIVGLTLRLFFVVLTIVFWLGFKRFRKHEPTTVVQDPA